MKATGKIVAKVLDAFLMDHRELIRHCLNAVRTDNKRPNVERDMPAQLIDELRQRLCTALGGQADVIDKPLTELYYPLWRDWARHSGDLDIPFLRMASCWSPGGDRLTAGVRWSVPSFRQASGAGERAVALLRWFLQLFVGGLRPRGHA